MSLSFRITCPHCGEPTRASAEAFYRWWPNETVSEGELASSEAQAAVASYCPECEGLLCLLVKGRDDVLRPILSQDVEEKDWGHFQADISLVEHVPKAPNVKFTKAVPRAIRDTFPDLIEDALRGRNSVAALALCRAIMENALKELEQSSQVEVSARSSLLSRIDRLKGAGVITASLADWAHEIRLDGNESVHELKANAAAVRAYAAFLRQFLDISFELPARILALREMKEAAKRKTGRTGL